MMAIARIRNNIKCLLMVKSLRGKKREVNRKLGGMLFQRY